MAKTAKKFKSILENKDSIMEISGNVHDEVLNTTNFVIDETISTLSRVQKIAGKAIKNSEPLVEKQIEMAFTTAEAIKSQAVKGGKRALKLVGMTRTFNKWTKNFTEAVNNIPTAEEVVDSAKDYVANAKSDVEKAINKATGMVAKETKVAEKAVKKSTTKAVKTAKKTVKAAKKSVTKATPKKVKAAKKQVATAVKVAPKKVAKAVSTELTQLQGIGPSVANKMIANNIKTIEALVTAPVATLEKIKNEAGPRFKNFDIKNWVEAAKNFKK